MEGKDDIYAKYKITVFPTFHFYYNGKMVSKVMGTNTDKLEQNIVNLIGMKLDW